MNGIVHGQSCDDDERERAAWRRTYLAAVLPVLVTAVVTPVMQLAADGVRAWFKQRAERKKTEAKP